MYTAAVVALLLAPAANNDDRVAVDLFFFGQRDPKLGRVSPGGVELQSGNPVRDEAFDYGAASADFSIRLAEGTRLVGNGALGWIRDRGASPISPALGGAQIISASPDLLTLDSSLAVEWKNGPWSVTPGVFYHHQTRYYVGGPNLDLARTLFDDNTTLFLSTNLRAALIRQLAWDGRFRGADHQVTLNVLMGWTQIWSPQWLTSVSLQYARQSGLLSSRTNFIALYDTRRTIRALVDEALPRVRHRGQLNARVRYAPAVGWALGVDTGGYADRWGLYHFSAEASIELPVFDELRLRAWYRIVVQNGVRYFVDAPSDVGDFATQDSDLADFVMHSPGALISVPLGTLGGLAYELRLALYGFSRTDGLFAVGGHAGGSVAW